MWIPISYIWQVLKKLSQKGTQSVGTMAESNLIKNL